MRQSSMPCGTSPMTQCRPPGTQFEGQTRLRCRCGPRHPDGARQKCRAMRPDKKQRLKSSVAVFGRARGYFAGGVGSESACCDYTDTRTYDSCRDHGCAYLYRPLQSSMDRPFEQSEMVAAHVRTLVLSKIPGGSVLRSCSALRVGDVRVLEERVLRAGAVIPCTRIARLAQGSNVPIAMLGTLTTPAGPLKSIEHRAGAASSASRGISASRSSLFGQVSSPPFERVSGTPCFRSSALWHWTQTIGAGAASRLFSQSSAS